VRRKTPAGCSFSKYVLTAAVGGLDRREKSLFKLGIGYDWFLELAGRWRSGYSCLLVNPRAHKMKRRILSAEQTP